MPFAEKVGNTGREPGRLRMGGRVEGGHESEFRPGESERLCSVTADVSSRQLGLLSLVERRGSGLRQKFLASLQNRYSEARGMERA